MASQDSGKVPYDKPGPAKGEAYGIAAVTQALEGLAFPASKRDVLNRLRGHEEIHWTKDKTVNLRTLIEDTGRDEFESMSGIVHFVSEAARQEDLVGDRGARTGREDERR